MPIKPTRYDKKKPDFLLCGFPKCGTWSLSNYLSQHPDIAMPKQEIHYFDKFWHKDFDWYSSQLGNNALIGEKTPVYVYYPERVKKLMPNGKFIFLLRNPIDRTYSHYWFNVMLSIEFRSFKRIIRNKSSSYVTGSCYKNILENWLNFFDKSQCMFILSENFRENPHEYLNQVFDFLGVDRYEIEDFSHINRTVMPKSRFISATLFPLAWLEKLSPFVLPRRLLKFFLMEMRDFNRGERYPKMKSSVHRDLQSYFKECNKGLDNLIGIQTSQKWK